MLQTVPWIVKHTDAPDFVTPYLLGQLDAQDGQNCLPEMYFVKRSQQVEYAQGWESVAGPDLLSVGFTGSALPVVLTDEDMAAHLADLLDGIATMEDHRLMMAGF